MKKEPAALGAVISIAVKATLLALASFDLPISETQAAAVALAVSTVVDALIFLGLIRGRVVPVQSHEAEVTKMWTRVERAKRQVPPGAVSATDHAESLREARQEGHREAVEAAAAAPVVVHEGLDPSDPLAPFSVEKYA